MVPESARGYKREPDGARGCQWVPEGANGCQMMGCQRVPVVPESARGYKRETDGARGCQMVPESAKECQRVSDGGKGCQRVPDGTRECQRVPDGASGCHMVPEGARGCQKDQIGTVVARGLGKVSELIFVKVSIAGVEVEALVDTGATTSCCRWDWYQGWKDHLGALTKSKVRVIGVGHDPIRVKGLTKPLTLHWDGVGGQFQLMVLTALTDVDVVLGMDVLRQLDVKINFKNQVASPAREPCTPLEPAKTVGLLLNNPGFTFKGKIPVKEEGVEEVAKGVLRQTYREVHRVWMASERKMKTKDPRKYRKVVRKGSMPWNKVDYKAQLQKNLEDIRQKLSQVLGRDLAKSDKSFVEATSPVNCIEGGVLVDLCMQRSGKRGSGCDAPNEADRFPRSADGSCKASEGFPTPVTSPLRPPKPPRTEIRQYSWQNFARKEVCMYIRILEPSKTSEEEEEVKSRHLDSTNYDVIVSGVTVASPNSDVIFRNVEINKPIARKHYVPRKRSLMPSGGSFKSLLRVCSRTFTFIALLLAIIISISGGLFNIRLPERKSTVGNSASLPLFEFFVAISCRDSLFRILREFSTNILETNEGLCLCFDGRNKLGQ